MQPRRKAPHFDAETPAITPEYPRSSPNLKQDNDRLRAILAAERKRHQLIEAVFSRTLTTLESQVANARAAYVEMLTLRPTGTKQ